MVSTDWLKKTELFGGLDEIHLKILLSHSVVESFPEGKTIFHQGDKATHLYILMEGAVHLTVKGTPEEKIDLMASNVDKEGAAFGIPSLIEPYLYNVTAACLKSSKVLTIEADRIRNEIEKDPRMGMEVMKKLASIYFNRLNEMRSGVSNLIKVLKLKGS